MKAIFKAYTQKGQNEISGHLEYLNGGQVKNSYGWFRTNNINKAFDAVKKSFPNIDVISYDHCNFNN